MALVFLQAQGVAFVQRQGQRDRPWSTRRWHTAAGAPQGPYIDGADPGVV
jgi:hypothetical protein